MNVLQFKNFSSYKNIKHGISTKEFGSMKDLDGSIDRNNLNSFLSTIDIEADAICMGQIHGGNIAIIKNKSDLMIKNIDGLVTDKLNTPLAVMTADCLPVLFFDPVKKAIGVVHAGRKGLAKDIVANIMQELRNEFGSLSENIIAAIGPGIEKKCYEVDSELVDIRYQARSYLLAEGIAHDNIEDINICTKCDTSQFYSYRRGDKRERFVSVICLI